MNDLPVTTVDLQKLYQDSNIAEILSGLDNELVGLVPVKTRIREVAALLLVESARRASHRFPRLLRR